MMNAVNLMGNAISAIWDLEHEPNKDSELVKILKVSKIAKNLTTTKGCRLIKNMSIEQNI